MIVEEVHEGRGALCRDVLLDLPEWFGNPGAVDRYAAFAESPEATMLAARAAGETLGMLTLKLHYGTQCEIHVLGVRASHHRRGVGRALLRAAEARGRAEGCAFLGVKTLGETNPDPHYARTRAFYRAMGFVPYERLDTLWGAETPCLLMIKPL
ncbi:MAG: GNAT family N-acetyltransferase [Pseudomonadota bacterium]